MNKQYVQLSLFNEEDLEPIKTTKKELVAVVECRDGTTFEQVIEKRKDQTPWEACISYRKNTLGNGYWIATYYWR